jgi:hypothetical protein
MTIIFVIDPASLADPDFASNVQNRVRDPADGSLQSVQDASLNRMDEPTGEAIRRGDSYRVAAERLDGTTLELAEELCRRFQLEAGKTRLELEFHNGRLELAWSHERIQLSRLADAYEPSRE